MTYFVTGATGFIGKRLVERLLEREGTIYVLVRPQSVDKARALFPSDRVVPVVGDLAQPLLGVDPAAFAGVQHVFHLAAPYDMTAWAAANDLANVAGTRNTVALANALGATLHHVSSVAVAGEHRGLFREDHFAEGQKLPTAYHRTKYEAEALVRAETTVPFRVYRPAVVVGDSRTGEMDKIDGPYYFFTALKRVRHLLPEWVPLIGPELGWTNIVPVDFVAAALDHIAHQPGLDGQAFHLTDPRGIRVGEALNAFAAAANAPRFARRVVGKLPLAGRPGAPPDWVACLARFDALATAHPDLAPSAGRREIGDPTGFYFNNLTMGIRSVAALADAFGQLDALPAATRGRLLTRLRDRPEEAGYMVSHPWVAERSVDDALEGRPRAETYLGLARKAAGWGETDLAVRCHVARSVMLDEYADDEPGAMAALQLAEDELGPHLALSRARAKVAFRRRRHGDALALLREVMQGGLRQDTVERMFLCREAAISASEVGALEEARDWFRQALAAAEEVQSDTLRVGVLGLRADVALAEWRCGEHDRALRGLWSVLEAMREVDPAASLKATYLHKVLGHACLWLFGETTKEPLPIPGQSIAPPGLCSNPEPPEDIRKLPRASLEGSHYLLAAVDIHRGGALGFDDALTDLLGDRHIFSLECQRRHVRLQRALAAFDLARLPAAIGEGLEAMCLGVKHMQALGGEPAGELPLVDGPFPRLPEPERLAESAQTFVNDMLFALEILSDLRGLDGVQEVTVALIGAGYAPPTYATDPTTRQGTFFAIWRTSRSATPPLAEDLFTTGLRMIEWARGSLVGRAVLPDLGRWAAEAWPQVLANQRFRLRNPATTVPAIEAALAAEMPPTRRLAAILGAARPAFKYNLGPDMLAMLTPSEA